MAHEPDFYIGAELAAAYVNSDHSGLSDLDEMQLVDFVKDAGHMIIARQDDGEPFEKEFAQCDITGKWGKVVGVRTHIDTIFRVFNDEVIALFPKVQWSKGLVVSYVRIGQHGAADLAGVLKDSRRATPEEYNDLLKELTSIGYLVNIVESSKEMMS